VFIYTIHTHTHTLIWGLSQAKMIPLWNWLSLNSVSFFTFVHPGNVKLYFGLHIQTTRNVVCPCACVCVCVYHLKFQEKTLSGTLHNSMPWFDTFSPPKLLCLSLSGVVVYLYTWGSFPIVRLLFLVFHPVIPNILPFFSLALPSSGKCNI
jgi:hypothetical protein